MPTLAPFSCPELRADVGIRPYELTIPGFSSQFKHKKFQHPGRFVVGGLQPLVRLQAIAMNL